MSDTLIGRYEIVSEIGRGGMAVVYLARDPNVNRQVAVKVLPRQFTFDPMFRERFQREAEVVAALEHPCIVPMYDFGEYEEQPFIVMRHMSGGSLVDRLRRGQLTMPDIEKIIERVGSALDEAHQKQIIHRDLKPGNILFDQRGDAYLSDFGIVKMGESGASLTGSGIIGTPAYMSPEQAQGARDIDGRSDIYSLGVILYEMLAGQPPYSADTPMRLVVKHILEPVPQLADTRPDLPVAFQAVLERGLAKDPDARYQTGQILSRDLHIAISGGEFEDPSTQMMMAAPVLRGGAAAMSDPQTVPAAQFGAPANTRSGQTGAGGRRGLLFGLGALALVVIAGAALAMGGVFGGKGTPTPTPQVVTATIDVLAQGYAQTITAQAALLVAPTVTITPTDTPTATDTSTPTATATRSGTEPPRDTATQTRATFTPGPTATKQATTAPATATSAQAGGSCPYACPGGMSVYSCDATGATCTAGVGHCEVESECDLFCPAAFPGIQLTYSCHKGTDASGNQVQVGVCICVARVP